MGDDDHHYISNDDDDHVGDDDHVDDDHVGDDADDDDDLEAFSGDFRFSRSESPRFFSSLTCCWSPLFLLSFSLDLS